MGNLLLGNNILVNVTVVVLFLLFVTRNKRFYYKGPLSPHYDGQTFYNPGSPRLHSWFAFLKWRYAPNPKPWPQHVPNAFSDTPPAQVEGEMLRVSWVGHVTFLMQTEGLNILTDPVWSSRASPFSWIGPKRVCEPGIPFEKLPKIDILLISHNHYDHLDLKTIEKLWKRDKPRIIVPLGNDTIIKNYNEKIKVEAYDWDQTVDINERLRIRLEPMHHWSARGVFDRNQALWAAFVIQTFAGNIYFAGDTGYGDGRYFQEALKNYGAFRLALLPIGAYDPEWLMSYGHMNPEEAILAFKDLGQPYTIPMHYGTFRLADEGYDEPLARFKVAAEKQGIDLNRFKPLQVGEYWIIPK